MSKPPDSLKSQRALSAQQKQGLKMSSSGLQGQALPFRAETGQQHLLRHIPPSQDHPLCIPIRTVPRKEMSLLFGLFLTMQIILWMSRERSITARKPAHARSTCAGNNPSLQRTYRLLRLGYSIKMPPEHMTSSVLRMIRIRCGRAITLPGQGQQVRHAENQVCIRQRSRFPQLRNAPWPSGCGRIIMKRHLP